MGAKPTGSRYSALVIISTSGSARHQAHGQALCGPTEGHYGFSDAIASTGTGRESGPPRDWARKRSPPRDWARTRSPPGVCGVCYAVGLRGGERGNSFKSFLFVGGTLSRPVPIEAMASLKSARRSRPSTSSASAS